MTHLGIDIFIDRANQRLVKINQDLKLLKIARVKTSLDEILNGIDTLERKIDTEKLSKDEFYEIQNDKAQSILLIQEKYASIQKKIKTYIGTAGVYTQKHPRCRNGNSISIEMCCRYDAGRYWLEDAVVANAALLTRRLMRKYGIPIENVLRHYDVVSKRCPAMWVDDENAWFAFKRQVMEVMEMTKEELLSLKGTGDHPSDWARQAAEWAKENGIFTGDSAGNFGWQQPITREAAAKLLYEYDQARSVDREAAGMVR